ncbi:MAG: HD-GYP domain-containing protein [Sulfuriflexus sp.]|nr:HD-GYP domain-containing protein [Sulfuriflexus sp.]
MKEKLEIDDLRKGMFVCELDRPWLDSPFLFQGFLVDTDNEMSELKQLCKYVYIDTEKGNDTQGNQPAPNSNDEPKKQFEDNDHASQRPYLTNFEEEIKPAGRLRDEANSYMEELFAEIRAGHSIDGNKTREIVSGLVASILRNPDALVLLNNLRDNSEYAIAHSLNVCTLTLAFGRYLGLDKDELTEIGMGALLHDVGELRVPKEVMLKEGLLSREENRIMQTHAQHGADILTHSDAIPSTAIEIARAHHERSNGQGYPKGLPEAEIAYFARIVGIVDVYDSVTTSHNHRESINSTEALKNMYNWRNEMFDGELVEQFIQCLGIYPVGSIVELDNGEVGIVIAVALDKRLQPKLMLVRDQLKKAYTPPRIINLALHTGDNKSSRYEINKVLEPGDYGIDLKSYLLREMPIEMQLVQ